MRILLIDDDEDLRSLLSRYIRGQWPEAQIEAYDPLERDLPDAAFPLGSYDVLVLDYMLGRGDGLEWLRSLKQRAECPKVLFLTGAGNEIIAVRAMKAGADDYQRKQELTREKLIASIRELTATEVERTTDAGTLGFSGDWRDALGGGAVNVWSLTYTGGKLEIETPGIPVQLDGDFVGHTPMTFSVEAGALLMSVPGGPLPPMLRLRAERAPEAAPRRD